jgi:hypothetical protein
LLRGFRDVAAAKQHGELSHGDTFIVVVASLDA